MRHRGDRTIKVSKEKLIATLKENKANHIEEYGKAVIAYKKEVIKQLDALRVKVDAGELKIGLNLVTPINNADNYDSIIEMFEWELADEVELSQDEFKEYVQDETQFAITAKMSNQTYLG